MHRSTFYQLCLVAAAAISPACATAPSAGPVVPSALTPAATSSQTADSRPTDPALTAPVASDAVVIDAQAMLGLARLCGAFELPFTPGFAPLAQLQTGLHEVLAQVEDQLAEVVEDSTIAVKDLTMLTIEPVAHTESSGFGWRDDPIRHTRRFHSGTDFRGKPGTPVMASGPGTVSFAGRMGGYGNMVEIDHGGGVITRYAHLRRIETQKNAVLAAGQELGQVGSTGRATGPHLHFEVRLDGAPVSALTALSVAALQRESPIAGRWAAMALSPELQARAESDVDPPKSHGRAAQAAKRPERPGRGKRKQVLW